MPLTADQRHKVIEVSESWLKTPYHPGPGARVKHAGVDCCQFLVAVYSEAGLLPDLDLGNYSPTVHLHREDTQYEDTIRQYANEITEAEAQPGDMVLYKVGRAFAHGAIIKTWSSCVIHAVDEMGVIYSDAGNERFLLFIGSGQRRREKKFFTLK